MTKSLETRIHAVMRGWQRVETAPKDAGFQCLFASDDWICPAEWTGEAWHIYNITLYEDHELGDPTHWMPLPTPPEKE